jgi:hypothetical protein
MYDMLRAEDEAGFFPAETRPRRYQWPVISKSPKHIAQLIGDGMKGFDVLWHWNTDGFFLQINEFAGKMLFKAQIPNWQMAEVEDVAEALISVLKQDESEDAPQAPKLRRYEGLRYMCCYVAEKPQIAKIKVQSAYDVYLRRGFVEISKEEFDSLVKIVRGIA